MWSCAGQGAAPRFRPHERGLGHQGEVVPRNTYPVILGCNLIPPNLVVPVIKLDGYNQSALLGGPLPEGNFLPSIVKRRVAHNRLKTVRVSFQPDALKRADPAALGHRAK